MFTDQLACADIVVLNKTDLVDAGAWRLSSEIEAASAARCQDSSVGSSGSVPLVLLGLSAAAEDDLASRPSDHEFEGEHDHDDFESFVVERGPVEVASVFLPAEGRDPAHDVLRIKGFIDRAGATEGRWCRRSATVFSSISTAPGSRREPAQTSSS